MFIYPTEFKATFTSDELSLIRKGLLLLRNEIKKKPGGWINKGKDSTNLIDHMLDDSKDVL